MKQKEKNKNTDTKIPVQMKEVKPCSGCCAGCTKQRV